MASERRAKGFGALDGTDEAAADGAVRAVSFFERTDGELGLVGYDSGAIYQIDLASVDTTPLEKRVLAETSERSGLMWKMNLARPADGWQQSTFDDRNWTNALGGFGSPGTPGAVIGTEWRTDNVWIRREFALPENFHAVEGMRLALRLHHDEDVEIYLNGTEILRRPRWTSGYIEVPLNNVAIQALRAGRNVLAVHCRQNTGGQYIDVGLVENIRPTQ